MKTLILLFFLSVSSRAQWVQFLQPFTIHTTDGVPLTIDVGDCFPSKGWDAQTASFTVFGPGIVTAPAGLTRLVWDRRAEINLAIALARMRAQYRRVVEGPDLSKMSDAELQAYDDRLKEQLEYEERAAERAALNRIANDLESLRIGR